MNASHFRCALVAAATVAAMPMAAATALPAIAYDQSASETGFFNSPYFPNDSTYVTLTDGSTASFDGSAALAQSGPYPVVAASSTTGIMQMFLFGGFYTPPFMYRLVHRAESQIDYYFTVSGPSQAIVPLTAKFNLSATGIGASNLWSAGASGTIRNALTCADGAYGAFGPCAAVLASDSPTLPYNPDLSFTVRAGDVVDVELQAGTDVIQTSPDQSEGATAMADPYIAIDPAWLAANPGYSLSFSAGIVNASPAAVPEPASWGMVLAGVGLVGGAMRRRKGNRVAIS